MNKQYIIYILEVFVYTIVLTYIGLMFSTVIDITIQKIENKLHKEDMVTKHILFFIQIGLIGMVSFILRDVVVYLEDSIVGKTVGNPSKYAIIIMGSVMFYTSNVLKRRINNILIYYNFRIKEKTKNLK